MWIRRRRLQARDVQAHLLELVDRRAEAQTDYFALLPQLLVGVLLLIDLVYRLPVLGLERDARGRFLGHERGLVLGEVGHRDALDEAVDVVGRLGQELHLREVLVEVPDITWEQVGGLEDVKQELKEAVEWPLKFPDVFERLQTKPPKGILLFGPPGTGKTLLAKAVANESECNFIAVKGPELLSKWVGESEKGVREIFRKARQASPSIIFFDEVDALVPKRGSYGGDSHVTESVVSQILTELDGMEELKNVTVLAATNRPDMLDDALLRPGRLERHIYVPAPDEESRKKILEVYLGGDTGSILAKDVDAAALVKQTEGYVGADIEALVREAKMAAMRDFIVTMGSRSEQERKDAIKNVMLTKAHFDAAILKVKGSLDRDAIEKSERQSWEMLYNQEQRTLLENATRLLARAGVARKKADEKAIAELRKVAFARKKDFTAIKTQTESLEKKLDKE